MKQAGCSCETWVTGIFKYKNLGSHKYGSSQWLEIYKVVFTEFLGVQVWQGDGVKLASWLQAVFFCLPDMPHGKNTAIRYRNQCGFCKIARASAAENDAFGIWAYWSVPNGSGCGAPCLKGRCLPWELLVFFPWRGVPWLPSGHWLTGNVICNPWTSFLPPVPHRPRFACSIVLH